MNPPKLAGAWLYSLGLSKNVPFAAVASRRNKHGLGRGNKKITDLKPFSDIGACFVPVLWL